MTILDLFPDLFNHIHEFLGDNVINSESQSCDDFVGFFEVALLCLQLALKSFGFVFVCTDFFHEDVLSVDQFESFFKRLIVISFGSLVIHVLNDVSKGADFSFVGSLFTEFAQRLEGSNLGNVVVFFLGFFSQIGMDVFKFTFRLSVELPFLQLFSQVSLEHSVNDAERCLLDQSIVFRIGNFSLLTWFIGEGVFLEGSSLLNL